ncbi:MAG: hypothetical protein P1V51_13330 [Deltaproteobacteria bacterium]|nr:hypothetical protein [Deltaproteobacteria bacterium]
MKIGTTTSLGLAIMLVMGLGACPKAPRWSGEKVSCESDADCRERFAGSEEVNPDQLWCDASVGFCIQVEQPDCATVDDCPQGVPCAEGSWACNLGRCELACVGCDVDGDRDGFGEGEGCAGPDCDDTHSGVGRHTVRQCYEGPEGTANRGVCRSGQEWCIEGIWYPCHGQVLPSEETCNGLDDDCDGTDDESVPLPTCGIGVCEAEGRCSGGALGACVPGTPAPGGEGTLPNGEDDDCDGVVDEVLNASGNLPDCIFVAPTGADTPGNDGRNSLLPLRTLQFAQAEAERQLATEEQVTICVAGGPICGTGTADYVIDTATEGFRMHDRVSIVGSYESTTWTECPGHTTRLLTHHPQGLMVPDTVQNPTALARMVLRRAQADLIGMTISGARSFTLSNVAIIGAEVSESTTLGLSIKNGAEVRATRLNVHGGGGVLSSVGIKVEASRLQLEDSCTPDPNAGGCGSCAGDWSRGIHGVESWVASQGAVGIELIDAQDTTLDRISICDTQATYGLGLRVSGRAQGVALRQSWIEASHAGQTGLGVLLECHRGAPEIAFNPAILASSDGASPGSSALGIVAGRDCPAVIHGNGAIVGAASVTGLSMAAGIFCEGVPDDPPIDDPGTASACQIIGNRFIAGGGELAAPVTALGVACGGGACARIEGNRIEGAEGNPGAAHSAALVLMPDSRPLVARNQLMGGCADPARPEGTYWAAGLEAMDSGARVENNAILGGNCVATTGSVAFGLLAHVTRSTYDLDVVNNTIDGGGYGGATVGIAFDSDPADPIRRGYYRNNVVRPGRGDYGWAFGAMSAGARPRTLGTNLVWLSRSSQALAIDYSNPASPVVANDVAEARAFLGEAFDVLFGDPRLVAPDSVPLDPHVEGGSACVDAGAPGGAPQGDFDLQRRDDGAIDLGADEL